MNDVTQIKLALEIATKAHDGQFRRNSGLPYITHPMDLSNCFDDAFYKTVCLLHDVVEDCDGYTLETLSEMGIDSDVLHVVGMLTHRVDEPYDDYIGRVTHTEMATKIKIADMMLNLTESPSPHQLKKYRKYIKTLISSL